LATIIQNLAFQYTRWINRQQQRVWHKALLGDLLVHPPPISGALNLEVGFEEVDDGRVRGSLPTRRYCPCVEDEPAPFGRGMGELIEEPGLAHARLPDDCHDQVVARACSLQSLADGFGRQPDAPGRTRELPTWGLTKVGNS
jgi:hypothetical protein